MHPLLRAGIVASVVGFGLLEATLGQTAEQAATASSEIARLRDPVLALALAFCACGQVALLVSTISPSRPAGRVSGVLMLAMAGLLVAIQLVTGTEGLTPPGFVVTGWAAALALTAVATTILILTARGQRAADTPAARAGSS